RRLRLPTRSDALRRLEATAGLDHRPLDAMRDAPALSPALWPAHLRQARDDSNRIRRVGRVPALSSVDRFGLRVFAPLLLALALIVAFGFSVERTRRALSAEWLPPTNPYSLAFEAWVDPPDYTGRPPIYAQGDGPIQAPEGSTLVVRAAGAPALPRPRYTTQESARFLEARSLGRNSVEARTIVDASGTLEWRIGPRRELFTIDVSPDRPPEIESLDPPETDKRDRLVLRFDASDDYGVEAVRLEMVELTDGLVEATAFDSGSAEVDTQAGGFTDATGRALRLDLTRHPLAGRKVVARLVAVDGAGQRGVSTPFYTTVPDRIFVEPLAKAIIEQRGLLLSGADDYALPPQERADNDASDGTFDTYQTAWRLGRAPAPVQRAVALVEAVTDAPDPSVFNDPVVYLGLRHVGHTLRYARSAEALHGLPDHMWTLAMRAEFGVLGTALQEMQEAEAALREGIARRAPQREIDTLFERYNQAVDAYMEELLKSATITDPAAGGGGESMGSTDEIQALLDAIEEANRVGDTEGARRALAQLAELLENMQMQITPGAGGGGEGSGEDEMTEEMREALEELAESLGEQRDLQDQTRQAERDELVREFGGETRGDTPSAQELADRQAALQELIDGLREELADTAERAAPGEAGEDGAPGPQTGGGSGDQTGREPGAEGSGNEAGDDASAGGASGEDGTSEGGGGSGDAFQRALEAMRESEDALGRGAFGQSREAQGEAIAALRDAGDALSRELAAQRETDGEGGTDPLGRGLDGLDSDNAESDIDPRDNAERSREILEELRRRAADAERDAQEQDYLDRLLRRF
ncbi:MAG: DUF4175 family protein, partial [Pseudomonadota bacterium]